MEEIEDFVPDTPDVDYNKRIHDMADQMFARGIVMPHQFPYNESVSEEEREQILDIVRNKFAKNVALIHQLPPKESDTIKNVFYNIEDNWFYRAFQIVGYDSMMVAKAFHKWLSGDINTIVLVGDSLTIAKSVFNSIVAAFPLAIMGDSINNYHELSAVCQNSSLYALPFVRDAPTPIMLHLMEGNSAHCVMDDRAIVINPMPMIIHCLDPEYAKNFIARNVVIFFMSEHYSKIDECITPRVELRDFVLNASIRSCTMNVHCKVTKPVCSVCSQK